MFLVSITVESGAARRDKPGVSVYTDPVEAWRALEERGYSIARIKNGFTGWRSDPFDGEIDVRAVERNEDAPDAYFTIERAARGTLAYEGTFGRGPWAIDGSES